MLIYLKSHPRPRHQLLAAGAAVLLLTVISCGTTREAVILPDVPGAKYIGSVECEQCHDELCKSFKTADHSRLIAKGQNGKDYGCESCHGPCNLHEDSGAITVTWTCAASLTCPTIIPCRRVKSPVFNAIRRTRAWRLPAAARS